MAEEIVACPGCGKKFRTPEGAPGGTFQCTACSASVPYGKAAKAAPRPAAARAAAPGRRRQQDDDGGRDERGGRGKPSKDKAGPPPVLWFGIGAVVLIVVAAIALHKPDKKPAAPPHPKATPATQPGATTGPASATPTAANPPVLPSKPPAASGGSKDPQDSAGSEPPARVEAPRPTVTFNAAGLATPGDQLFIAFPDVAGVTGQERAAFEQDIALLTDQQSGKSGIDARKRLVKAGRKVVPALLSTFKTAWNGKRWDDDREKYTAEQVQRVLAEITKADNPAGDFIAQFDPRDPVPATQFERAARIWTVWWNTRGKDIEKFKAFAD